MKVSLSVTNGLRLPLSLTSQCQITHVSMSSPITFSRPLPIVSTSMLLRLHGLLWLNRWIFTSFTFNTIHIKWPSIFFTLYSFWYQIKFSHLTYQTLNIELFQRFCYVVTILKNEVTNLHWIFFEFSSFRITYIGTKTNDIRRKDYKVSQKKNFNKGKTSVLNEMSIPCRRPLFERIKRN